MSKIRLSTALFLLFSIIFGIGTYIFTPVSQIIATSCSQVFILSAQAAVLIFSCLNMIHVERQKKCNEKFIKYLGIKFAEDLYNNKAEEKE